MTPSMRAQLARFVDHRPEVLAALDRVVARHRDQARRPEPATPFDVPRNDYIRRRRVAAKLLRAFERLERALDAAPEDLLEALAGSAPHLESGSLDDWQLDLAELGDELSALRAMQRGRRGAPVNSRRRGLEDATVRVLSRAGFRLTKARDGRLAKILTLVYEAADERGPEDVFPVLKRLLRHR